MGKHRQTKSLGSVASFSSSDNAQEAPLTPEERIAELERRVATLETLLNDVIRQLDKAFKETKTPKPEKKELKPSLPVKKSEIDLSPLSKQEFNNEKQNRASELALAEALESLKALLSDGVKRTQSEILQQLPSVSKRKFERLRSELENDGNEDYAQRLYFLEDTPQ